MKLSLSVFFVLILSTNLLFSQIVINEVLSSNSTGIVDEDGEYVDWIELYNSSTEVVNLEGYSIDDRLNDSVTWFFPSFEMSPQSFLVVYASGKDRKTISLKYHTIIDQADEWQYKVPSDSDIENGWRLPGFDDSDWQTGKSGFGYGDGDDETVIQPLQSIFIRKEFQIENINAIEKIILHVDFDDGFIAFINGTPIALENVNVPSNEDYNLCEASGSGHEAQMYGGGEPESFEVNLQGIDLYEGANVLSIQGYNVSSSSSDFTLIPFLTLASTSYSLNQVSDFVVIEDGGLHTDFKISKNGESLYLFDSNQNLSDSVQVVELPGDVSYGRYIDGEGSWYYFPNPSPGERNISPAEELSSDTVHFSKPAGFYQGEVHLTITSETSGMTIKYTLDGTAPVWESETFGSELILDNTTVVKAAPFKNDVRSGPVVTKTFVINAAHQLPVVSLSTDPHNLFDYYDGIFQMGPNAESSNPYFGANFWMDWEKPMHLEYFDVDGEQHIDQGIGAKVFGGWSRAQDQKSLALFSRSQYGSGSLKHAFFNDLPFDKFESVLLRNGGNDFPHALIRDGLSSELAKSMDIDRLAFQPTVVYINGEYWGIMNMREKPNEHYFKAHYDVDDDELNLIDNGMNAIHGSANDYFELAAFLESKSTLTEEDYIQAASMLDVESFIDYQLFQIYLSNTDWPGNNIKFWSTTNPHSQIRMLLYDTDFGWGLYNGVSYPNHNSLEFATDDNGPSWPNPPWSTLFLRRMLANEDFQHQFVNRFADLLNTHLSEIVLREKFDSVVALVDSEMPEHQERWGRSYDYWQNRLVAIEDYIDQREGFIKTHFRDYFDISNIGSVKVTVSDVEHGVVKVNTIIPDEFPYKGYYFSGIPIDFKALPKIGYRFVRWEGASVSDQNEVSLTIKNGVQLHAVFEEVEEEDYPVVINEINYFSNEDYNAGDWVELYNAGNQTINMTDWKMVGSNVDEVFTFPEGTVFYPYSYLVVCRNTDQFSQTYPNIENIVGDFTDGLSSQGDVIEIYDAMDNLIDQVVYETRSPWDIEPLSSSSTLELLNPEYDNTSYNNWGASQAGGTPGRENGLLVSNDLMAKVNTESSCFPTKFRDYTTLRFHPNGSSHYVIRLMDIQGNIKKMIKGEFLGDETHYLDIFTEHYQYSKGIYLVNVETETYSQTIKVIKL